MKGERKDHILELENEMRTLMVIRLVYNGKDEIHFGVRLSQVVERLPLLTQKELKTFTMMKNTPKNVKIMMKLYPAATVYNEQVY